MREFVRMCACAVFILFVCPIEYYVLKECGT